MTNDEIYAEIRHQVGPIVSYGGSFVIVLGKSFPGLNVHPGGFRLKTHGAIPLDFLVTNDLDGGIAIFVNSVGNREILENLPREAVIGGQRIPDSVFRPGDEFIDEYRGNYDAIKNYNVYPEVVGRIRPRRICEIGVRAGYSAYSMLSGAPTAHYYEIDLDANMCGGTEGYIQHAIEMLPREFPDASIEIAIGNSQIMETLPGERFDLVHVDGDHSHDGTLHDLEMAARCSDWVLIDDADMIPTVGSAIIDFLERHPVTPATFYPTWRGHVLLETRCHE